MKSVSHTVSVIHGTAVERTAIKASDLPNNQEVLFRDESGSIFHWNAASQTWIQTSTDGAIHVANVLLAAGEIENIKARVVSTAYAPIYPRSADITLTTSAQASAIFHATLETTIVIWPTVNFFYMTSAAGTDVTIANGHIAYADNEIEILVPANFKLGVIASVAGGLVRYARAR